MLTLFQKKFHIVRKVDLVEERKSSKTTRRFPKETYQRMNDEVFNYGVKEFVIHSTLCRLTYANFYTYLGIMSLC